MGDLISAETTSRDQVSGLLILQIRRFRHGDGWKGWAKHGPYDGIIVTAAPERIPTALLEQLAPGGRLVLPLGPERGDLRLMRITRGEEGFQQEDLGPASFVPLVKSSG